MKPVFQITADGTDITPLLLRQSVDLSISDVAGIESDSLTINLNRQGIERKPARNSLFQ